jgi:hypothetical protein
MVRTVQEASEFKVPTARVWFAWKDTSQAFDSTKNRLSWREKPPPCSLVRYASVEQCLDQETKRLARSSGDRIHETASKVAVLFSLHCAP